jgi:rhodanese-related sulfurtransferase
MMARLMGLPVISPEGLLKLVEEKSVVVVDVNSRESWTNARVPGATNLDPLTYDAKALPEDKTKAVVFYCSNSLCRKAPNAARRARQLGHTNVKVMSAGIKGWLAGERPTEQGE